MRLMGIDPGMTRLGYATVNVGASIELISYGVISHPIDPALKFNAHLNAGIARLADSLPKLVYDSNVSTVTAETVPPGKLGSNDALVIAAITTCKVICHQFGINWLDIAASTIKKEMTGDGRATKARMKNQVLAMFPEVDEAHKKLKKEQRAEGIKASGFPFDVFDAISVAVVGANKLGNQEVQEVQEG